MTLAVLQIGRWTRTDDAEALARKLIQDYDLKEEEAVPIINCMPESIEEIRVFFLGGRRIMETSKLKEILALLDQYRKRE